MPSKFGAAPTLFAEEPNTIIQEISWGAGGTRLAYVDRRSDSGTNSTLGMHICAVDIQTKERTVLAAPGMGGPVWSLDGKSLFYWQVLNDEGKEASSFLGGYGATWRAYRVVGTGFGRYEVSDLDYDMPGVFSPDGKRLAGISKNVLVVEDLATHHQRRIPYAELLARCQ